ncbi:bifunctional metallophosphatase/5'-nucleotidase [Alteribacter natronophilus]|uniref:bifunctional metallophosphatase/5'-nucleotidase n=1 Tax=Alteribacter natronophilus TaxID=2583810 RepID=UPI001486E83C|nr:bifunctional UDP-sugar hydrolase/5'-nucleotidase [Alteribacter natronophilus]
MSKSLYVIFAMIFFISIPLPASIHADTDVSTGGYLEKLLTAMDVDPGEEAAAETAIRIGLTDENTDPAAPITIHEAAAIAIRSLNLRSPSDTPLVDARQFGLLEDETDAPLTPETMQRLLKNYRDNFERVTIVSTNDVHGRISYNPEDGELGMAKIAAIANRARARNDDTYVFDAGDTFHGTTAVNLGRGETAVALMNRVPYDAMTPGNHDFNYGTERLRELIGLASFPVLSANTVEKENKRPFSSPYMTFDAHGKTFAVIGVTTQTTVGSTDPENVKDVLFLDEIETAKRYADELRKSADHIIVLSHSGIAKDKQIAEQVDGIDLIVGGHSHTAIEKPLLHHGTYLTQSAGHGRAVSVADLVFFEGDLVGMSGSLVRDHPGIEPDKAMEALVEEEKVEWAEMLDEVIAVFDQELEGGRTAVRTRQTSFGTLITDAFRVETGAEAAFTNGGNIRAGLPEGPVTRRDLLNALPFANTVVVLELSGSDVEKTLEQSVSQFPGESGGFLQVSGIDYSFNAKKPPGSRIADVRIAGEPLVPDKMYTIATNSYLANGGNGYKWLADLPVVLNTGEIVSGIVERYMRREGELEEGG